MGFCLQGYADEFSKNMENLTASLKDTTKDISRSTENIAISTFTFTAHDTIITIISFNVITY